MESINRLLNRVIDLIEKSDFSSANLSLSNFYYKRDRNSDDYLSMLKLIKYHRRYVVSSERTKQQIARILYTLDKRYNSSSHPIFVKKIDDSYTIQVANASAT